MTGNGSGGKGVPAARCRPRSAIQTPIRRAGTPDSTGNPTVVADTTTDDSKVIPTWEQIDNTTLGTVTATYTGTYDATVTQIDMSEGDADEIPTSIRVAHSNWTTPSRSERAPPISVKSGATRSCTIRRWPFRLSPTVRPASRPSATMAPSKCLMASKEQPPPARSAERSSTRRTALELELQVHSTPP